MNKFLTFCFVLGLLVVTMGAIFPRVRCVNGVCTPVVPVVPMPMETAGPMETTTSQANGMTYSPVVSSGCVGTVYSPVVSSGCVGTVYSPVVSSGCVGTVYSPVVSSGCVGTVYSPVVSSGCVGMTYSPGYLGVQRTVYSSAPRFRRTIMRTRFWR